MPPGALKDFNQAIRLSPSDKKAWFNRAGIKAGSGDIKGAIEDLDKAIGLDPQNSDAFFDAWYNENTEWHAKRGLHRPETVSRPG